MTSQLNDLAEEVALITYALLEALDNYPEPSLPGGYRFHIFDGFTGFCDYAAASGLALHRAFEDFDIDSLIEIVDGFAARVIAVAVQHSTPASATKLAGIAEETRRRAVRSGLAMLRMTADAEKRNCGETQKSRAASLQPHTVFFELRQGMNTIVYAQDPAQAVEVGKHLFDLYDTDTGQFTTDYSEAADWSARLNAGDQ